MTKNHQQIELLRLLASRLERLSVDSHWARRASGLRGNIIKLIELADEGNPISTERLDLLTDTAFDILRKAAEDIPDLEELYKNKLNWQMKKRLMTLGLLLVGCSAIPGIPSTQPSPPTASMPTRIDLPSIQENTLVPHTSPYVTKISEVSPFITPALTITETPTDTPISWTYIFPIEPSTVADFSEGTPGHGYPATDIFAPEGAKFVAVTDGVVNYVSYEDRWDPEEDDPALRGGLCVAIIGDDGVRYYGSHLSAIERGINPGVRVTMGQILGYVGRTGDARTTPSHLHFGISPPTYPEDWHARRGEVDPFPFLEAWLDGQNVTPPLPTP